MAAACTFLSPFHTFIFLPISAILRYLRSFCEIPNANADLSPPLSQPYGQYPGYYNPGMQAYPPPAAYAQQQGPPSIPPITPSGTTTPSTGVRTPSVSGPAGIPPSPSPASNSFAYSSPQPQASTLPHHGYHASLGGTPLRAPGSPFSLSAAAHASEFKPNVDVPAFVPTPRKSAAIKIRNPKDVVVKEPIKEEKPVEVVKVEAKVEEKVEVKEDDSAKVAEEAKKVAHEKSKKDEEERVAKEASEKEVAQETKVAEEKAAAVAVAAAAKEKEASDAAAAAAAVNVAEEKKKGEEAAAALALSTALAAAAKPVVEEPKVEAAPVDDDVKVAESKEVVEPVVAATLTPTTNLPSFLPSKPVNSAVIPDDKPKRAVPASLDLSSTKSADVSAPLPSALASARAIENLATISYPADIKSPRPDLNADSEPGKYRYDREFLMQFMMVCVEKPDGLPNLEAIGMVDSGADAGRGGFSGRGGPRSSMGPPAVPGRSASGAQFGSTRSASTGGAFGGMGNFGQGQQPLGSSQARFEASLAGGARAPAGSFQGRAGGSMSRQTSQSGTIGGASFAPAAGGRVPSRRGQPRESNQRGGSGGGGGGGGGGKNGHVTGQGFEDAAPLEASETGWKPDILGRGTASGTATPTSDSPEMVVRKVKALLNKLTLEKFDSISDQILEWADKSVNETDGRILRQVIALIFEKATDEANWSEMYARLCRKLMEKVSVNVKDERVKGPDGVPVAGGALFRKYLLNRCQEDYESGWKQKEVAAAAAAGKAADDNAKKEANDAAKKEEEEKTGAGASSSSSAQPKEAELLSDEYYAAQKAKRRGLGLVRFIGELYRLSMLTERIMHECIKKLLANTDNPEEEDVESLCRLLTTVGKGLDNAKAKQHMDIYFTRMKMISDNLKISSRIRFMIQVRSLDSSFASSKLTSARFAGRSRASISAMDASTRLCWTQAHLRDPLGCTSLLFCARRRSSLMTFLVAGPEGERGGKSTNGQLGWKGYASSSRPALPTWISSRSRSRPVRRRRRRRGRMERTRSSTTSKGRRPQLLWQNPRADDVDFARPLWNVRQPRRQGQGGCSSCRPQQPFRHPQRRRRRRFGTAKTGARAPDQACRWQRGGGEA